MAGKIKQGSWKKALIWLAIGLALGFLAGRVSTVIAQNNQRVCFCHNVNNNPHTVCTSNQGEIRGHRNHVNNGNDTRGRCAEPSPTPTSTPEEPAIQINRPELACGVNHVTFNGSWEYPWDGRTEVKFFINGREPEVFTEDHTWRTGELTLAPTDYKIRVELWGYWRGEWTLKASQDGRFTIDECSTVRICHWNEEGYEALAVTEQARTRHFNAHKEDKDWVEGMDAQCELPPEPTPTPTPTHTPEPQPEEHHSDPSAPQCTATAPVLLPGNPLVWRLGGTAIVQWQPTEGNKAHIYYYQNEDSGNAHALRDIDNNGYAEIHELSGLNWTFGIQQAEDCAGGEIVWIVDGATDGWVLFTP